MTQLKPWRHGPRRSRFPGLRIVAAALFGALVLAGCSSTHVGESWQCPLAQGASCESVAAADPAVPARVEGGGAVLPTPLYRVRAEPDPAGPRATAREARRCDADCGPFAWLARLFGTDSDAAANPSGPESSAAKSVARPVAESALPLPVRERPAPRGLVPDDPAPMDTDPMDTAPTDTDPMDSDPMDSDPMDSDPVDSDDDLREAEVVGRIWIAPFVDADGIYREGAYVRAVLAPAGWRLP